MTGSSERQQNHSLTRNDEKNGDSSIQSQKSCPFSDDKEAYSTTKARLKVCIMEAKLRHQQRLE